MVTSMPPKPRLSPKGVATIFPRHDGQSEMSRLAGDNGGMSIDQPDASPLPFASAAWRDEFDPAPGEGVHDLVQAVDDGPDDAVARLHPLDRRKRELRLPRQFLLVDAKQGPGGLHL